MSRIIPMRDIIFAKKTADIMSDIIKREQEILSESSCSYFVYRVLEERNIAPHAVGSAVGI